MQINLSQVLTQGELTSPEPNKHINETSATVAECAVQAHPAPSGSSSKTLYQSDDSAPRLVIRGESLEENTYSGETFKLYAGGYKNQVKVIYTPKTKEDGEPLAALTDYLNTTFPFISSPENVHELKNHFAFFLGEAFDTLQERRGGLHGYKTSFDIGKTGGMLAYGGQRGTALVSLPGSACAQITDWYACYHLFNEILKGRITRWDGAVDVFDGSPSVDDAVKFYISGRFNAGGNKASCSQQGNWIEADGSGRTFYVGKRKNGKLLRVYEKGKQLGNETSPWVRWELELHNRDRIIPWDVLLEPGKYVAASYACMGWVSDIQERIRTTQHTTTISYEHLSRYAKQAYGKLIGLMLEVEGSPEKVIERLKRPGIPSRLNCGESSPSQFINRPKDQNQG